jgi:type VI protein secretion system component VasK
MGQLPTTVVASWIIGTFVLGVVVLAPFAVLILVSGKGNGTARVIVIGVMTLVAYVGMLWRIQQERQNRPDREMRSRGLPPRVRPIGDG